MSCLRCILWLVIKGPIGVLMVLALSSSRGLAQTMEIDYSAPKECPNREAFLRNVQQIFGRSLVANPSAPRFRVTLEKVPAGYRCELVSEHASERAIRTFSNADCTMVAHAAALSVVMAIAQEKSDNSTTLGSENASETLSVAAPSQPKAGLQSGESGEPPGAQPALARRVRVRPIVVAFRVAEPMSPRSPIHPFATLELPVDFGTMPAASFGARLGAGVALGRWSGLLAVSALLPQTVTPGGGESGARFQFGAGRAVGCLRIAGRKEAVSVSSCGVFEGGLLMAQGIHLSPNGSGKVRWLAPGARLLAAVPLFGTRLRGVFGTEILIPLERRQVTMDGSRVLHETNALVGRADVGLSVDLE